MGKAATISPKAFRAKQTLTRRQQDDSRHRMMAEVSKLANRLRDCALSTIDDPNYEKKQMTAAQLKAAEIIMNRTVPTLSAIQIVDDGDNESLTREEIQARIKEKIENNPMIGVLAGLTPKTIEAHDITQESDGDE